MKTTRSLLIILFLLWLCRPFVTHARPAKAEAQNAGNGSAHKTIQVDWQAELTTIQSDLKRDPNSASLHAQAAVAYDALGDFNSFNREIQTAMRLDQANSMPYYMAYAIYKRRHLFEEQRKALEQAIKIDPTNPFGHYQKASMLERAKRWRDALREYEVAQGLLEHVKSDSHNFQNGVWIYTDERGNPFDVNSEQVHIADDINRLQLAIEGQK